MKQKQEVLFPIMNICIA